MTLATVFASAGVKCAHIIDDAFDSEPTLPATAAQAQAFVDQIDAESFDKVAKLIGIEDAKEDDLVAAFQDVDLFKDLFNKRKDLEKVLAPLFDAFLTDQEGKRQQVQPLLDLLKKYDIDCRPFGARYMIDPSTPEPQLVFIDLKLREGQVSASDAVKVYEKLVATHSACKPFVFLMSSIPLALDANRVAFRAAAKLFESQFETIEKKVFTDEGDLSGLLARNTKVLPQLNVLHTQIEAFETAVSRAAVEVLATLRAIDLADYFALFHNTTSVEEIGLGTYVTELLLEYFAHEIEAGPEVWDFAASLDALRLEDLPRSRFGLHFAAGKLYSANLLHAGRRLTSESDRGLDPAKGHFFLGDIFLEAKEFNEASPTKAYTIITPACDLARLDALAKRSILLCEGRIETVKPGTIPTNTDGLPAVVMQHPNNAEQQILITWNKKKLHVWDKAEMEKFQKSEHCHYIRVARLRPLYALQLQRVITADLSRVGTQRPPSLLVPHGVRCFISNGQQWQELDGENSKQLEAAALSDSKRPNAKKEEELWTTFVLSDPVVERVRRKVIEWLQQNEGASTQGVLKKTVALEEFVQRLMYFNQNLPADADGGEVDRAAYPFQACQSLTDDSEKSAVAIVRPKVKSPYSGLANNQAVKKQQKAVLVFLLTAAR